MQEGWKVFSHLNGKSRKKLLACLLSISMIPVNGFTVMAATADQGNQAAVTQEGTTTTPTVTSGISFAAESKDVKVGSFHYYRFQGTDTANIDKVTLKSADESALKIEQRTVKDAEGKDVIEYMPIALKDKGTVKVTATFESKQINKGTIEFEFNLAKADDNVVPVTSYSLYEALGGTNGQITKAELAAKKEINLSNKNLTDTDVEYLKDATGCEKLDLSNNINVKKIDALKSMTNLKEINLVGTSVSTADKIALIKTNKITVEKGTTTSDPILPKGCTDVKYSEDVATGTAAKLKLIQDQTDKTLSLEAIDTAEAGETKLKVESKTTPSATVTIPVTVTAKSETSPQIDKNIPNLSVGTFNKEVKVMNVKSGDVVSVPSKDNKILNVVTKASVATADVTIPFIVEAKAAGKTTLEATITRDGKVYKDSIDIEVKVAQQDADGKTIIPLTSITVYNALKDVDANKDGSINSDEIKKVKSIELESKDLTNADLAGLSEAVNCEKINLENNKNITNISFVKNLKQLKELYLRGTAVTDFTALNDLKAQLNFLFLPSAVSTATRLSFLSDTVYLKEGQELSIKEFTKGVFVNDTASEAFTITSSNTTAVSITGDKIKAGTKGQMATLTLKAGTTTKTIKVYTTDETGKIPTQAVVLNKTFVTLNPGKIEQLKITYLPDYATASIGTVKWTSSNEAVVTVDAAGKLTAKAAGKAIITAITSDGNVMYCIVTVENIKVSKITITTTTSNKIATGKKVTLKATVTPSNAYNKGVTWKSSNTKVATVVTTKKKMGGKTVTITATAKDGSGKKASYKIYVKKGIVKKVYISGVKSVKAGKKLYLKGKTSASSGANRTLKWSSSNTKYAKVSSKGTVTTYKAGKKKSVKITARAVDGSGKSKTVTIKIK